MPHTPTQQVKMAFGGPNRVDGRLLALLRTMYARDRRLFAVSNVTYEVRGLIVIVIVVDV